MKILLPVDGSPYTKRMLAYIGSHAELLGPNHEYTAFTAVPAIPPHAASYLDRKTLEDYYRDQAEQVLQPVRAFADQQGWRVNVSYAVGHAVEQIATLADKHGHDL